MGLNRRSVLFVIFLLFIVALGVSLGLFLKNPPEATKSQIVSSVPATRSTDSPVSTDSTVSTDAPASSSPEMAVEDTKGPIELVSLSNRDLDGSPALALTFSKPLDAREKHDDLIQVFAMPARLNEPQGSVELASTAPNDVATAGGTPVKGAWVVGENPRMLFFPHIKPQTRYVVYVAPGVLARNGKRTTAESRYSLYTAAVSPAYYFASKGMVLPAKQNGGLPVITVNVPEVDIQFLRVKPEQLPAFLERVFGGRNGSCYYDEEYEYSYCDYYDYGNHSLKGAVENYELSSVTAMTESVYSGRFLTEQKPNRRSVTFIPVEDIKELAEPGIYIAVMSQPNRFGYNNQVTYFYTSNLGLHTRLFAKEGDVYVSTLDKGDAVSGAEVSWLDEQGKILLLGKTDSDGRAHFDEWPRAAKVLLARQGKQVTMIALREPALDLSEFDASGPSGRPVGLFVYSGRNLYRPGEQFAVSVLARDADGHPIAAQPVQAILKAPGGKAQFTATWKPSDTFSGYYQQTLEIPADAATGAWNLELRADPADPVPVTVYRFNVEEFLPERMKLDLEVANAQLDAEHPFDLNVTGNYLYGAPAARNSLLGAAQFLRNVNPLPAILPGFVFGDVNEDAAKSREELPETKLDDDGKASVNISLSSASSRNSPFLVRATMSLLESGGRPVIRTIERTYWPAPQLLAVRPLYAGQYAPQGSLVEFDVLRADAVGKLSGGTFPARLFRENRAYYWSFDDQRGWHSGYTDTDELEATATVTMAEGKRGKLALQVKWGRYRLEIDDPGTGKRLVYRFYAGWDAMDSESQGNRPDRVALKLDKPAYREGETARLTITPPHGGEALITVEGDSTLWVKRIALPAEGRTVDIPISTDWHRHDLYVSVVALRPGSSNQSVTPARALGLIHLPLSREDRKLSVKLNAPPRVVPQTPLKVKIQVPEAKGKKAHVTLSAVDVGILNITSFKTPDPISYFFARHRYGADIYDVYGRLIEKMAGQKGKLKFGGDAPSKPPKNQLQKVRLIDIFSGPVALDSHGAAEITLDMPDFNGTLRLMAVAAAPENFGNAESEVIVAAPLVAELATPRFLNVGDSAVLALDLHNLSGQAQKLRVEVLNEDGLRIADAKRQVSLKDQEKITLRFPIEAGSAFGLVPVEVKVSGDATLSREFALQVQASTPARQLLRRYVLAPGERADIQEPEMSSLIPSTVNAHLGFSRMPPLDVKSAIQGLLMYPYGCVEQTTSSAYPHVFVDEEAARSFGLKPFTREQRVQMLDKAIASLAARQAPIGGFSLWGGSGHYEYWLSAYVSNFLIDAIEQGFDVPETTHKKAMDFLLKGLQEGVAGLPGAMPAYDENRIWRDTYYAGSGRFTVLAYGAYVLAREGKAPLSTLRQLYDLRAQSHSGLALVHLGLALSMMGDEQRASTAIRESFGKTRLPGYWWGDYGSQLRDASLAYALLNRHKRQDTGKENLLAIIAADLDQRGKYVYTSTQEKLALFLAGRQMAVKDPTAKDWQATLQGQTLTRNGPLVQPLNRLDVLGSKTIKVSNPGSENLYLELVTEGFLAKVPPARNDVMTLSRAIFDAQGNPIGDRPFRVGESVLVRVSVAPVSWNTRNALVVDKIPAGLEIENLNIVQGESMTTVKVENVEPAQAMQDSSIQHVEFRDDRFAAALYLNKPMQLFYRARVVTPGRFIWPQTYGEDMYIPSLYGLADNAKTVTVVDDKSK